MAARVLRSGTALALLTSLGLMVCFFTPWAELRMGRADAPGDAVSAWTATGLGLSLGEVPNHSDAGVDPLSRDDAKPWLLLSLLAAMLAAIVNGFRACGMLRYGLVATSTVTLALVGLAVVLLLALAISYPQKVDEPLPAPDETPRPIPGDEPVPAPGEGPPTALWGDRVPWTLWFDLGDPVAPPPDDPTHPDSPPADETQPEASGGEAPPTEATLYTHAMYGWWVSVILWVVLLLCGVMIRVVRRRTRERVAPGALIV